MNINQVNEDEEVIQADLTLQNQNKINSVNEGSIRGPLKLLKS